MEFCTEYGSYHGVHCVNFHDVSTTYNDDNEKTKSCEISIWDDISDRIASLSFVECPVRRAQSGGDIVVPAPWVTMLATGHNRSH